MLLHPDLRPISDGQLKDNYNSFDIVEIEQIDEEREPRDPSELILEIRKKLVESEKGKKLKVPVRFHYDKMRRISQEDQDFYFAPLPHTPFSLGLVLPHDYGKIHSKYYSKVYNNSIIHSGNTWIKVGDEIRRNQHMNVSISDFFVGQNWKVHPEWVYCKYHYLEGHEFAKPEEELTHFLKKLNEKTWKWSQQYETDTNPDDECLYFLFYYSKLKA